MGLGRLALAVADFSARNGTDLPLLEAVPISAPAEAEESGLKKDLLEVLAKTLKPFEEPCPRIETPWPRPISGFHPVFN